MKLLLWHHQCYLTTSSPPLVCLCWVMAQVLLRTHVDSHVSTVEVLVKTAWALMQGWQKRIGKKRIKVWHLKGKDCWLGSKACTIDSAPLATQVINERLMFHSSHGRISFRMHKELDGGDTNTSYLSVEAVFDSTVETLLHVTFIVVMESSWVHRGRSIKSTHVTIICFTICLFAAIFTSTFLCVLTHGCF